MQILQQAISQQPLGVQPERPQRPQPKPQPPLLHLQLLQRPLRLQLQLLLLLLQHGSQLGLARDQLPSVWHARATAGSATTVPALRPPSQLTVAVARRNGSALSYTMFGSLLTHGATSGQVLEVPAAAPPPPAKAPSAAKFSAQSVSAIARAPAMTMMSVVSAR
jgi:hypothetical protein